jgi:gliding motility-associated lipoprotein GldH
VNFEGDTSSYDVIFTFRTSTDYAYNNLWIYLTTAGPMCSSIGDNAVFFGRKAKELKIAKPNGEWLGQKSGTFIENKLYYIRSKFCKGTYTFKLEQGITMKEMQNISDVTIEVKPTY